MAKTSAFRERRKWNKQDLKIEIKGACQIDDRMEFQRQEAGMTRNDRRLQYYEKDNIGLTFYL